jgi:hypothetical protein
VEARDIPDLLRFQPVGRRGVVRAASACAVALCLLVVVSPPAAGGQQAASPGAMNSTTQDDSIPHPPDREEFVSADGRNRLIVSSADGPGWKQRRSVAEMQHREGTVWRQKWRLDLPHEYRPRFALATPQGGAVFLDEWINVKSRLAIMVIDSEGHNVSVKDLDMVVNVLGVAIREVVAQAKFGWWLQSPPTLSRNGQYVEVKTAGAVLRICLSDGDLSLAD